MLSTLKMLAMNQMASGQFPTTVINEVDGIYQNVHTITPTYLVCLILNELRERSRSHYLLDQIVRKGAGFLVNMSYVDPISGLRVWHFNSFYQPDWEETAWCSYLAYRLGLVSKKELKPLRDLAFADETHNQGVGVWLKDSYSAKNRDNNVFDPVVSLSVSQFLSRIFNEKSGPTNDFLRMAIQARKESLYYANNFRDFFFYLFGLGPRPSFKNEKCQLFHHGNRTEVWYASADVWEAAKLI